MRHYQVMNLGNGHYQAVRIRTLFGLRVQTRVLQNINRQSQFRDVGTCFALIAGDRWSHNDHDYLSMEHVAMVDRQAKPIPFGSHSYGSARG